MISAVLVTAVVVATRILEQAAREQIALDLQRTSAVVVDLQAYRDTLFAAEARVVAEEPRIKAVVISEETTAATILGVAREMYGVLGSELFVLVDRDGRVDADVLEHMPVGTALDGVPPVGAALARGHGHGIWIHRGDAFQLHAHAIALGGALRGAAVIGHRIDDRMLVTIEKQTGSAVIVMLGSRIIAASSPWAKRAELGVFNRGGPVALESIGPVELDVDGTATLAMSARFPGSETGQQLRYVVLRSLGVALAPAQRLTRILEGLLVVSLLIAFVVAVWWARRLSRPIDRLLAFTRAISAGQLANRAPVSGTRELQMLSTAMNTMAGELQASRDELAEKARLQREVEIAAGLQTALLPKQAAVTGLEISTHMTPSTEVGGDYFDIVPAERGCWIGIGDVAGHGLRAGVVMLMLHSVIRTLIEGHPHATPRELVVIANRLLYAAVRKRLGSNEHITFTLLRFFDDGRVVYAGAHEPMLVCGRDGSCRLLATPGTWLVATPKVERVTVDTEARLEDGDVVVMYSDGVTEARDGSKQFGIERMRALVQQHRTEPTDVIAERIVSAVNQWSPVLQDDVSLVVARYRRPKESP